MNNFHYLKVVGLIAIYFSLSVPVPSFFTFTVKEVLQHNLDCDLVLGIKLGWLALCCNVRWFGGLPCNSCQNPFIGYCESLCAICLKLFY